MQALTKSGARALAGAVARRGGGVPMTRLAQRPMVALQTASFRGVGERGSSPERSSRPGTGKKGYTPERSFGAVATADAVKHQNFVFEVVNSMETEELLNQQPVRGIGWQGSGKVRPRILVLGSGWAACSMIKNLDRHTLRNYEILVAAPRCSTTDEHFAEPVRTFISEAERKAGGKAKIRFVEARATDVDPQRKMATLLDEMPVRTSGLSKEVQLEYEVLVMSTGAENGLALQLVQQLNRIGGPTDLAREAVFGPSPAQPQHRATDLGIEEILGPSPHQPQQRTDLVTDGWLRVEGAPEGRIFALGDCARATPKDPQAATQEGEYLAKVMNSVPYDQLVSGPPARLTAWLNGLEKQRVPRFEDYNTA